MSVDDETVTPVTEIAMTLVRSWSGELRHATHENMARAVDRAYYAYSPGPRTNRARDTIDAALVRVIGMVADARREAASA